MCILLAALLLAGTDLASAGENQNIPSTAAAITVPERAIGEIDTGIFGVNYVWHLVPRSKFDRFVTLMSDQIHPAFYRYPGGWAAESLDWTRNAYTRLPSGGNEQSALRLLELSRDPGVDPNTFLAAVGRASFVLPSGDAIRDPESIGRLVRQAVELVRRYGARVKRWEIGNEWWLQRGAKHDPSIKDQNLERYASLVAKVAPAIKAADPTITVFATGEWNEPEEFATLRDLVGEQAWQAVDGVSIHPYCGDLDPDLLCASLPERVGAIRRAAGRDRVFASEWALGPKQTADDFGIRNANRMVEAIRDLIAARITEAAYWPPVRGVPEIALLSSDDTAATATGLLFGWMSSHLEGRLLAASGDLPVLASRSAVGTTIIVACRATPQLLVRIRLQGANPTVHATGSVLYAADADDPLRSQKALEVPLALRVSGSPDNATTIEFDANPGTAERGKGWEIALILVK